MISELSAHKKRVLLRRYLYHSLKPISGALGIFYFFYFLGHALLIPNTNQPLILGMTASMGLYFLYVFWAVHRGKLPSRRAEFHAFVLFQILLINSFALAFLYRDIDYATNFILIQVCIGAFLLPPVLFLLCSSTTLMLTALFLLEAAPPDGVHFAFSMVVATGLGYILHRIRLYSIFKMEQVLRDNQAKRRLLQQSLKSANMAQALAQQRNCELQEAMQALRENEEKFRSLVELSPDIIGIHKNGKIIFINPAGVRMLEAESAEQVIGRNVLDLLHPDYRERVLERIKQAMQTGKPVPFEEEKLVTLKGNLLDVEVAAIPFTLNGETAIQVVARDISARKEFEHKLQAAREAAVENSRLKSQFLANISHELRTPLNGIIGMASLLHNSVKGTEQQEFLLEIKRSAEILQSLIDEILDFSRLDTGAVKLEEHEFNLRELLNSIVHIYSFNAYNKNLEISCFISSEVPAHIVTDARKLRKILSILVENSIKFTQKGEIFIHVGLASATAKAADAKAGTTLLFSVQDTGVGIPEDKWDIIFEPFRQLDGSHTRKVGGIGLGLALCQRLVQLLGGEIWLDSRPGHGSNFYFSIPLKSAETSSSTEPLRIPELHPFKTVLLLDHNRMSRKNLKRAFKDVGIHCICMDSLSALKKRLSDDQSIQGDRFFVFINLLKLNSRQMRTLQTIIDILSRRDMLVFLALPPGEKAKLAPQLHGETLHYLSKPLLLHDLCQQLLSMTHPEARSRCTADRSAASANGQSLAATRAGRSDDGLPRSLRILLAEDNPVNEKIAVKLLEKQGFQVTVARDGEEAVQKYLQSEFDLILMDIQMPKMSGIEATYLIRQHEKESGRKIPIIAVTAHAMKGDREQLLASGLDGYVPKPIRLNALLDEMLRVWKLHSLAPQRQEDVLSQMEHLNLQHLLELLDYDNDMFLKMLDQFYQQCVEFPARLSLAISENNAEALSRYAHEMQDVALYFGAEELIGEARALQHCAARNDFKKASQILLQIREILGQIQQEIELLRQHPIRIAKSDDEFIELRPAHDQASGSVSSPVARQSN